MNISSEEGKYSWIIMQLGCPSVQWFFLKRIYHANGCGESCNLIRFKAVLKESQLILTLWLLADVLRLNEVAAWEESLTGCSMLPVLCWVGLDQLSIWWSALHQRLAILRNVAKVMSLWWLNRLKFGRILTLHRIPEWKCGSDVFPSPDTPLKIFCRAWPARVSSRKQLFCFHRVNKILTIHIFFCRFWSFAACKVEGTLGYSQQDNTC